MGGLLGAQETLLHRLAIPLFCHILIRHALNCLSAEWGHMWGGVWKRVRMLSKWKIHLDD